MYPNLVHHTLQLSGDVVWTNAKYEIMDVSGKRVASGVFSATMPSIELMELAAGFYQLAVVGGNRELHQEGFVKME